MWPKVTLQKPSKFYSNPRCFQLGESWKVFRRLFPKDEQEKPWTPEAPQATATPNDSDPTDKFIALVQHTVHRFVVENKSIYSQASEEEKVFDRRIGLVIVILHEVFNRCRDNKSPAHIYAQILASLSEFLANSYVQHALCKALDIERLENLFAFFEARGSESVLHAYEWLKTMGPYAHSGLGWRFDSREGTDIEFDWNLGRSRNPDWRYYEEYGAETKLPELKHCTVLLNILYANLPLGNLGGDIFLLPPPRLNSWEILGPWDDDTGYPTRNDCDSLYLIDLLADYKQLCGATLSAVKHFEVCGFIRRYDPALYLAQALDKMVVDP